MKEEQNKKRLPYKSFCWSLGTTSFRTKDFNKTIETQLFLLNNFWEKEENLNEVWAGNIKLQERYYEYMKENGFVYGDAQNKAKDAREKTSGLVDIGLIFDNRRLSPVGEKLLEISLNNDFSPDNFFQIPKDSFLYLKQLLKTSNSIGGGYVNPFIVLIYCLSHFGYLSVNEFCYLIPLCTNKEHTEKIINGISFLRRGEINIDDIIIDKLMSMDNYREALKVLINNEVSEEIICEIGLNRKSRSYDKDYYVLYNHLYDFYIKKDSSAILDVFRTTKKIKLGKWWRNYIFKSNSESKLKSNPEGNIKHTMFDDIKNDDAFKEAFFKVMHLFKAKATLLDYFDLNRRYIKTTDIVIFKDDTITLDVIPKYFFTPNIVNSLYSQAYKPSDKLFVDCDLVEINPYLVFDEQAIINGINSEFGVNIRSIEDGRTILEDNRYRRFNQIIDSTFSDEVILSLFQYFENREDEKIHAIVTDNADIPTIFEYVLGIMWYKISDRKGKILSFMKLSLDVDLLPKSHAVGGEADIVYEYEQCLEYQKHSLLIEATLSNATNQRRMEMESVSRHLGEHLIAMNNPHSYCVFATNKLNINVVSDFRGRKNMIYYDSQDLSKFISGMKIIPLEIPELEKIIKNKRSYKELYPIFESAFNSNLMPHDWYQKMIADKL